jgi:hypothetical protein
MELKEQEGATAATASEESSGTITQADIERAKAQIGIPKFAYNKPYNEVASRDVLRRPVGMTIRCGMTPPMAEPHAGATRSLFRYFSIRRART